jgi:hypothetical protein
MAPTPLFLLSPPRAGSTLLQRMLGAHEAVATASEPWVLLPPLTALDATGAFALWNQWSLARGVNDFASGFAGGEQDYLRSVAAFARDLYARAAPDAAYFLDKTPRYHLIADRLLEAFGDEARFVFLWRNPLAIAASFLGGWGEDRWNLHHFADDLFNGVARLADAYRERGAGAAVVRFEELVAEPERELERLLAELGLPPAPGLHERFREVELPGHHFETALATRENGRLGRRQYAELSREPLDRWRRTFANPLRRRWAERYLAWLGDERLRLMGYERRDLLGGLERRLAPAQAVSDAARIGRAWPVTRLRSRLLHTDVSVWR